MGGVTPGADPELSDDIDWDRPVKFLWLLGLIDRVIQRQLQQQLAPHHLSLNEYSTLAVLQNRPGLSNADLARRSLVTPQSMSEVIGKLEQRGLIERRSHPDHGRILLTEVSESGRELMSEAMSAVAEFESELVSHLDVDDFGLLKDQLTSVLSLLLERSKSS